MGAYRDVKMQKAIQMAYGVPVEDIKWMDSFYAKSVVACLTASGKRYAWKRCKVKQNAIGRLYRKHRLVAQAELAPTWHLTKRGRRTLIWQGRTYYLTDWVDGQRFGTSPSHAYALGQTLGKLHNLDTRRLTAPSTASQEMRARCHRLHQAEHLLSRGNIPPSFPTDVKQFLKRHHSRLLSDIHQSLHILETQQAHLTLCLIHGDVTVPNVLIENEHARLIDWERLRMGFAVEELAKTTMNVCNLSPHMVERLLDGYGMVTLTRDERRAFQAFLQIPREIIYLLLRGNRRLFSATDTSLWRQIIATWEERQRLIHLFA